MTREDNGSFIQRLMEFWGRKEAPPPVDFNETSLLSQANTLHVGWFGHYLSLPPMTAAILISPSGQKMVFIEGGFKHLQDGAYTIQYVDLRERTFNFPPITATTLDGFKAALTVSINYKVNDPVEIANIAKPLDALLAACEAAVKKFIITHYHHQIIGEPGNEQVISDEAIVRSIEDQVAQVQACRAFELLDVVIKERYGDPNIGALKHEYLVQEKKSAIRREGIIQEQEIAEEQKNLAMIQAEQERLIQELQAITEANRSEILEHARRLSIQLDYLQNLPEMQKAQAMRRLDVLEKALDALIHAQTIAGFPRDAGDMQLLQNILGALAEGVPNLPQIPSEHVRSVNESRSTIVNLLSPRKKKGK